MRTAITKISVTLGAFFGWWLTELAALAPRRVLELLFPTPKFLLLEPSDRGVALWLLRGTRSTRLTTVGFENRTGISLREHLQQHVRRIDLRNVVTVLRIPASRGLRFRLRLPAAAEQDLRSALALQVDRQTPFTQENAAFDYRVLERDRQAGQVSVEMAVAPRQIVKDLRERCNSWGLQPEIVDLAEDGIEAGLPQYNLNAESEQPKVRRLWRAVNLALAVLALVLLGAVAFLPLQRDQRRAESLLAQVAETKSAADDVLRLRGKADQRQTEAQFFAELKAGSLAKVLVLEELTRVLPDDTWLRRFAVSGREVRITGYSPTASGLVGLIDESEHFGTPKFLSTVTTESDSGLESFKFSFEIEAPGGGPSR